MPTQSVEPKPLTKYTWYKRFDACLAQYGDQRSDLPLWAKYGKRTDWPNDPDIAAYVAMQERDDAEAVRFAG